MLRNYESDNRFHQNVTISDMIQFRFPGMTCEGDLQQQLYLHCEIQLQSF